MIPSSFVLSMGLILFGCSDDVRPDAIEVEVNETIKALDKMNSKEEAEDLFDPRMTDGDEEDSSRGPVGGN